MTDAIIIGIVSYVFVNILLTAGMIFEHWWWVLNRLPEWLAKPLGACEYCLAGQIALWYYIFTFDYNLLHHIAFISIAILTVKTLNKLLDATQTD